VGKSLLLDWILVASSRNGSWKRPGHPSIVTDARPSPRAGPTGSSASAVDLVDEQMFANTGPGRNSNSRVCWLKTRDPSRRSVGVRRALVATGSRRRSTNRSRGREPSWPFGHIFEGRAANRVQPAELDSLRSCRGRRLMFASKRVALTVLVGTAVSVPSSATSCLGGRGAATRLRLHQRLFMLVMQLACAGRPCLYSRCAEYCQKSWRRNAGYCTRGGWMFVLNFPSERRRDHMRVRRLSLLGRVCREPIRRHLGPGSERVGACRCAGVHAAQSTALPATMDRVQRMHSTSVSRR